MLDFVPLTRHFKSFDTFPLHYVLQNKQRLIATSFQLVLTSRFNLVGLNILPD